MIKLIVYIVGLSGLIDFDNTGRKAADVVLINAQSHEALLEVQQGDTKTRKRKLQSVAITIHCGDGTTADPKGELKSVATDEYLPWRGLGWGVDVAKLAPTAYTRSGYMKGADGHVSAVLRLTKGTLGGASPTEPHNPSAVWKIGDSKSNDDAQRKALTDRLKYTLDCSTPNVEVHLHSFTGGTTEVISIKPSGKQPKDLKDPIVVTISNRPKGGPHTMEVGGTLPHVAAALPLVNGAPNIRVMLAECDPRATCSDPIMCPWIHLPPLPEPFVHGDPPPTVLPKYMNDFSKY